MKCKGKKNISKPQKAKFKFFLDFGIFYKLIFERENFQIELRLSK